MMMEYLSIALKIGLFISIVNVWFIQFNKPTPWRAVGANSMREEFRAYGFSETIMYIIGGLKVFSALAIFVSIWVPALLLPAASLMTILMIGAIFMHLKIKDPLKKSLPALIFLLISLYFLGNGNLF
jgi:hypothetical protein